MVRSVLHHGADHFEDGAAAHNGSGRERPGQFLGGLAAQEVSGLEERILQPVAGFLEGSDFGQCAGLFFEVQVEAFGAGGSVDEPLDGLCSVRDMLGDGHHAVARAELRIAFLQHAGGAIEEIPARKDCRCVVVKLCRGIHAEDGSTNPARLHGAEIPMFSAGKVACCGQSDCSHPSCGAVAPGVVISTDFSVFCTCIHRLTRRIVPSVGSPVTNWK
jgi:hypothetical protein